ncbi:hypothetical protein Sliba_65010 [Streptomyces nigrescens]|uniref:Uncharacterized protein n=1 Tax=Streptomyces nigrescens TaxID=1920 RepID=A0A640TR73_STRNI|nr:hypothetical protein Sliba_65010 [Streptomyces libani subsp. libani]GGW05355.1 hypothetical protein GCM10010500_69390 [Streptomyces libani subsp. libani]
MAAESDEAPDARPGRGIRAAEAAEAAERALERGGVQGEAPGLPDTEMRNARFDRKGPQSIHRRIPMYTDCAFAITSGETNPPPL